MNTMFLIAIIFLFVVFLWQSYQIIKLAKICEKSFQEVWEAIEKINEGSYLTKED